MDGNILITGSGGQIGTVLSQALRKTHGVEKVICTDLRKPAVAVDGPFEILDVTDSEKLEELVKKYKIDTIYHLAALLSSSGELNINLTWTINFTAYQRLLEIAVRNEVTQVFFPSTIGIYGPTTPALFTPQHTSFEPQTIYGISKYTGELWGEYYRNRYDLDVRSLRYPGVISHEVIPEGGTTDFAVEIFFDAIKNGHYNCYLEADTMLPMIYMPDVIRATLGLMNAKRDNISTSMGYNISGFSVTPLQIYSVLKEYYPELTIDYKPDHRQMIADSWSETIDDSLARKDWDWRPEHDLNSTAESMLKAIKETYSNW